MSLVKSIARRVARGVSRRVARNELFEKRGERAHTPPLSEPEASGAPQPARREGGGETAEAGAASAAGAGAAVDGDPVRLVSEAELAEALRPSGRPLVVHHWATWCEPCAEELPRIEALASALSGVADVVGLCWELFDTPDSPEQAVETVRAYTAGAGLSWPSLIYSGSPESLFAALEMSFQKIPQTRVVSADGACLEEFHQPLTSAELGRVRDLVGA